MRTAFATLVFAGLALADPIANPIPQAVTAAIAPSGTPPAGCYSNYDGVFLIGPVNTSSSGNGKRDFELDERNTKLGISLRNGILTDPQGRIGYVAANQQFQFDGPPQAGAIWTAGFSVCTDGRLTLGSDQTWWKCLSGSFFNLYYKSIGGQCIESYLIARGVDGAGGPVPGSVTGSVTTLAVPTGSASGSASTSASGSVSNSANGTVVASSSSSSATANSSSSASGAASGSSTIIITGSSTTITTVVGGAPQTITTAGTKVTIGGSQQTTATGGQQTTTTTGGGGSPTTGAAASSSSPAPGAAPLATLRSELFGLAAGVLALAAL